MGLVGLMGPIGGIGFLGLIGFLGPMGLLGLMGILRLMGLGGGLVPEEILALGFLLLWGLGTEHGFERIRVVACVPHLGGCGHGSGREVLHLLQVEAQLASDGGQLGHVFLMTARVAGDEVRDDLLVQMLLDVDAVEDALEVEELLERGFAHEFQYTITGVLRSNLQTSADMTGNELSGILLGGTIGCLVATLI